MKKIFKALNYTKEDRLIDEILFEETMISRLHVSIGFAMTPIDLETILSEIDKHEKRLELLKRDLYEYRHTMLFTISGKCDDKKSE